MNPFKFFCCDKKSEGTIPEQIKTYWDRDILKVTKAVRKDFKAKHPELYAKNVEDMEISEPRKVTLIEASENYLALCTKISSAHKTGLNEVLARLDANQLRNVYVLWRDNKRVEAVISLINYGVNLVEEEKPTSSTRASL
jgi:hypothetical protein